MPLHAWAMTLETLISRQTSELTAADRKIADLLLGLGREAAFLSSHEVSRRTGLHPASAIRFARKLGFAGYPELQAALKTETLAEPNSVERMRSRIGSSVKGGVLAGVISAELSGLMASVEQVPEDHLEDVAKRLIKAKRICVHGAGHGAIMADYFALRLVRSGYDARSLHSVDWQAVDTLAGWGAGDEIVIIALRRLQANHLQLIDHARSFGIGITLIGDLAAAESLPAGVPVLAVRRGAGGVQSIVVPSALINALIIVIGNFDDGRSLKSLELREAARKTLQ